jgi:two-component system, NarL family, nitrate/nitrite response regulator NarL
MPTSEEDDPIRIAVIDDHPIMREGLIAVLGRDPGFLLVGEGGTAKDAVDLAEELLPDIMLLDVNMPGDGLTALQHISSTCPTVAVIILTVKEDPATVSIALKRGARGYVLKGIDGAEMGAIIRLVHHGDAYITPTLAARLLTEATETTGTEPAGASNTPQRRVGLTVREGQILQLLADGMSNKQIAGALALSESTIKHYMTNLMQKLQVSNRVEAALLAKKDRESRP